MIKGIIVISISLYASVSASVEFYPQVECLSRTITELGKKNATLLCTAVQNAENTLGCFQAAKGTLETMGAIALCSGNSSVRTLECYRFARRHLSKYESIRLCLGQPEFGPAECFSKTLGVISSHELAVNLCAGATDVSTYSCFWHARVKYFDGGNDDIYQAIHLCRK